MREGHAELRRLRPRRLEGGLGGVEIAARELDATQAAPCHALAVRVDDRGGDRQRRLRRLEPEPGIAAHARHLRDLRQGVHLLDPVADAPGQPQPGLEVLARLGPGAECHQQRAQVAERGALGPAVAELAVDRQLLACQRQAGEVIVVRRRHHHPRVEEQALDGPQPERTHLGQAGARQRLGLRQVAQVGERVDQPVLGTQPQRRRPGELGVRHRVARRGLAGAEVAAADREIAAPPCRLAAPRLVAERLGQALEALDVGPLLGAPSHQVERALAHVDEAPAQRRVGGAFGQGERARHVGQHRLVGIAFGSVACGAGEVLPGLRVLAGLRVVPGNHAQQLADSMIRRFRDFSDHPWSTKRRASQCATRAW